MRKPSLKKSISARTTGKIKRSIKKTLIPEYGKNGIGLVKNPKKSMYNNTIRQLFQFLICLNNI